MGKCIRKCNASEAKQGKKNPFYGKHHSIETREKMSDIAKGRKSHFAGRQHTMETRGKISDAQKGDKGNNWQGGVSSKNNSVRNGIEFRLWREAVFARDNWTCQECGKHGGQLFPHHIKSFANYPELRLAIDNGKTLCLKCHKLTDTYGGKGRVKGELGRKTNNNAC